MQHLSVEIFAQPRAELHAGESKGLAPDVARDAIAVFHRWIQRGDLPELLIDVADYAHLPAGPGVVLMGHEAAYSLDTTGNRLGLLYNRKERTNLDDQASLRQAYEAAVEACRRLEREPEFQGKLRFDVHEFALIWNDRLLYSNTDESWDRVRPAVAAFLEERFGAGTYTLTRAQTGRDSRERLSAEVRRSSEGGHA